MTTLDIILIVLLVLAVVGIVIVAVGARRREESLKAEADRLRSEASDAAAQAAAMKAETAALQARLEAQKEASDKERDYAAKSLEEMKTAFKALSAENSEHFRKTSAAAVGELLKPIQEKFDALGKSVHDSDVRAAERGSSLEKMVQLLSDQSKSVGAEARALADAITGQSKVQGDFGEMLLTDLLRASGLEEGVNFDVQKVILDDDGHEIRSDAGAAMIPDVIVHYPDGGEVIVDSKVSLKAFVAWNQAVTAEERSRLAKEHVRSIEQHITELRDKDYTSYIPEGRKKIDYNIMFIPIEGAFQLMQQEAPLLWQKARDERVLIVSQMSLSVVLNMVLIAWRQHDQQRNIEEVYGTAAELMSALGNWMDTYARLGDAIEKVGGAYRESTRQLKESNQSVVKKIAKLEKLRVGPKRSRAAVKAGGRKGVSAASESIIPAVLAQDMPDE
ncbi:MAG: DNA recombination protein RmuC [Bacteroidales bacterium]|nr:DNA recombination protein RmuC [Bacteroidales bacterium]